jgi:hypothetical protein
VNPVEVAEATETVAVEQTASEQIAEVVVTATAQVATPEVVTPEVVTPVATVMSLPIEQGYENLVAGLDISTHAYLSEYIKRREASHQHIRPFKTSRIHADADSVERKQSKDALASFLISCELFCRVLDKNEAEGKAEFPTFTRGEYFSLLRTAVKRDPSVKRSPETPMLQGLHRIGKDDTLEYEASDKKDAAAKEKVAAHKAAKHVNPDDVNITDTWAFGCAPDGKRLLCKVLNVKKDDMIIGVALPMYISFYRANRPASDELQASLEWVTRKNDLGIVE